MCVELLLLIIVSGIPTQDFYDHPPSPLHQEIKF